MNVKKFLREQAEKNAENLLDENDLLYLQQFESVEEGAATAKPRRVSRRKLWAIISPFVTVAVAAVIIFPSVFVKRKGDIFYQEANVREVASSIEDLRSDLEFFDISVQESDITVLLNYDSISNDKLYYTLEGTNEISLSDFKFYVIINENYNYNFELNENLFVKEFNNYNLKYEYIEIEVGASINYIFKGKITVNTEIIYIEYNQIIDLGEQAFFDDIESIIKVKS